ncbi:leucine zipper domain-containing protein [Mycobacteroides abscessus]|uniref:leucine zipper domain-containing protein n=1 Tax=Mycobacteroides abscessus TaxID=36809 RepID=UPI001F1F9E77|nr:leucine zipper domain-containing protein [Mycobacteroides abscessus]
MSSGRTTLLVGERVLTDAGTAVVAAPPTADGIDLKDPFGNITHWLWVQLPAIQSIHEGQVDALSPALRPLWDSLDDSAREVTLWRLEIVQEIETGYRDGHPELARPGEPRRPFGPGFGLAVSRRCEAMAVVLSQAMQVDHQVQRRVRDGEIQSAGISPSTIGNWVRRFRSDGLLGLIDGRSIHTPRTWECIDERYRQAVSQEIEKLDGDHSTVSLKELDRRARVKLIADGVTDLVTPERATQQYLSTLKHQRGKTTRAQRTARLHEVSGTRHYPAIRPGQIVAIDATTADNLVYDPLSGRPISVQILTAICVATRVVLALRVVPLSANGFEAGLLTYDVCRPFSLSVKGTDTSRWRWCGLPESLDMSGCQIQLGPRRRRSVAPDFTTLEGEHAIPSVRPDAIRCDHGSIFLSALFFALLRDLGIDLLLSRTGKPTDNPHVERWHETLQRGFQQIPGYKGRNVSERGRLVAQEPLLTARGLQDHLRKFVALDYHRDKHDGLVLPGQREQDGKGARLCPLEMWDVLVELTGRIDVPQRPDLIYQFLPVRWLTIDHNGVNHQGLIFNSDDLDPYRAVPKGYFRPGDRAAPFHVDPNDLSRIWFRDPETTLVKPIPWSGADRLVAPLTQSLLSFVYQRIRDRGGNSVLTRNSATRQILAELTQLTEVPPNPKARAKIAAGAHRVENSQIDHREAQSAQDDAAPLQHNDRNARAPLAVIRRAWPNMLERNRQTDGR